MKRAGYKAEKARLGSELSEAQKEKAERWIGCRQRRDARRGIGERNEAVGPGTEPRQFDRSSAYRLPWHG